MGIVALGSALAPMLASGGAATAATAGTAAAATGAAASTSGILGSLGSFGTFLGGTTGGFSNLGILSSGLNILGGVGDFITGGRNAKAMAKAQKEQHRQVMMNVREQYRQLGTAEQAAGKDFKEEIINNQVSLLQQQAQVQLMAGATGTGGASVTSMLQDLSATGGRNQAQIVENFERQQEDFKNQAKAIRMGGAAQMQTRTFEKPSAIESLVSTVGDAASGYLSGSATGREWKKAWTDSRRTTAGVAPIK